MRSARRRIALPGRSARLVLLGVLLAGTLVYQRLDKDVLLVVDGRPTQLSTLASSVDELLEDQEVRVSRWDRVRPAPTAGLTDGMRIEVLHAKEIQLVLNGRPQTLHVIGQTVQDVLEQINVRAGRHAAVRPSRSDTIEDGDVIEVRHAVSIRLFVEGKPRSLITNAPDVGFLLDSLGIIVRRNDRVSPAPETAVTGGMDIRVVRVTHERRVEDVEIPFGTVLRKSDDLIQGERRIAREGRPGIDRSVFRVRLEDGRVAAKELLSERRVRDPVAQIVHVGTRSPDSQVGTSSWYHRTGMVAAHKTLPKGTRVRVTNLANGRAVTVVIDDRGPFVNGWIIDLSDDAFAQLAPLSTGIIRVRLEW